MHSPPMLYAHLFAIITCLVLAMAKVGSARQATVKSVFEIPSANLTVMKRKVQVDSRVVASGLSLPKFVEAEEGKHSVLVSFYCVEVDEVTGETKPALPHQTLVAFTNQKTKRDTFFLAKHDTSYSNTEEATTSENGDNHVAGNRFIATVDLSKQAGRFKSESGTYDLTIFVGGHNVPSGHQWKFGAIGMRFDKINREGKRKTTNQLFDEVFDAPYDVSSSATSDNEIFGENSNGVPRDISTAYLAAFAAVNVLSLGLLFRSMSHAKKVTQDDKKKN